MAEFLSRSKILILCAGLLSAPAHAQDCLSGAGPVKEGQGYCQGASLAMAGVAGAGVMAGMMQAFASMDTSGLYDARQAVAEPKPDSSPAAESVEDSAIDRAISETPFLEAARKDPAPKKDLIRMGKNLEGGSRGIDARPAEGAMDEAAHDAASGKRFDGSGSALPALERLDQETSRVRSVSR